MTSKRNKIFLVFTFTITWVSWWILSYLTNAGVVDFKSAIGQLLFILGGSAPTVVAFVAVALTKKDGEMSEFTSRILKAKVKPFLYFFAVLTPVALGLVSLGIVSVIDSQYLLRNPLQPVYLFISAFFISIVFGGIEEIGWRGILQPSLTKRFSLIVSNFIIGIIWALWHLPLFYVPGTSHYGKQFIFYGLAAIGYSSFLTWLYAKTNSIFLCILFHAAINATAAIGLSVSMAEKGVYVYSTIFIFAAGILFLVLLGKSRRKTAGTGMDI